LPLNVDDEHVSELVRVALMEGCRGIVFRSQTRLDETDPASRRRAAALELLNRQLQLLAPWMAAGSPTGEVTSIDGKAAAGMLFVDGAHLLVFGTPGRNATANPVSVDKLTSQNSTPSQAAVIVPGIPDASQAWTLTPDAMRQLAMKRVAGGMRIVVDSPMDAMVVITQDSHAIGNLKLTATRDGAATLRLARDFASMKSTSLASTAKQLAEFGYSSRDAEQLTAQAANALKQADVYTTSGRLDLAHAQIAVVIRGLEQFSRKQSAAVRNRQRNTSSPLLLADDTLYEHLQMVRASESLVPGENRLAGGDFEDLDDLARLGWQHFHDPAAGASTNAELAGAQPQAGRYSLKLSVGKTTQHLAAEGPAVRILSPTVAMPAGRLCEITGWVRVLSANGEPAELQINDTLGGPELALQIPETSAWSQFRMLRVGADRDLQIAFSLAGSGSAEIDSVEIRTLEAALARRLPQIEERGQSDFR
jgi:hypothetical protein